MIKLTRSGTLEGATDLHEAVRALAQDMVKREVLAPLNGVTDNSTGSAAAATATLPGPVVGAVNAATNLAQKAATETALGTVKNAISVLLEDVNAKLTALGLPTVTDNSGGTIAVSGTVAAITKAVTAAATGCDVAGFNAVVARLNGGLATAIAKIGDICEAGGDAPVKTVIQGEAFVQATIAAISTDTGTAASPGVTKAEADAVLTALADAVAEAAAALNTAVGAVGVPKVIASR